MGAELHIKGNLLQQDLRPSSSPSLQVEVVSLPGLRIEACMLKSKFTQVSDVEVSGSPYLHAKVLKVSNSAR